MTIPVYIVARDRTAPCRVIRHRSNDGPRAAWQYVRPNAGGYYAVADGDLAYEGVPHDLLSVCVAALRKYPDACKVGTGLRIDDVPADYPFREELMRRESVFWRSPRDRLWFNADIDTTFAVYDASRGACTYGPALRAGYPYVARHLPWYETPATASEAWLYFAAHSSGHTGAFWTTLYKSMMEAQR